MKRRSCLVTRFGDAPGSYGAGVAHQQQKMEDMDGSSQVYTTWGSHAYGKRHGDKLPEIFSRRMRKSDWLSKMSRPASLISLMAMTFQLLCGLVALYHSGEQTVYLGTSDTDHIETLSLHEELSRVMRAKICNPKWVEG